MVCVILKSCGVCLPAPILMKAVKLPAKKNTKYLGGSLGPKDLLDKWLIERLDWGPKLLVKLRKTIFCWNLSLRERRTFIKTFIHSITDYAIYIQPLMEGVTLNASSLDKKMLVFALGMPLKSQQAALRIRLKRLLSLQGRRRRYMV